MTFVLLYATLDPDTIDVAVLVFTRFHTLSINAALIAHSTG